jgi:hypothetical protein
MEPISWSVVAGLVLKYGIPFVDQLIRNIQNDKPVTSEEWAALKVKIDTPFDELVPKVGPPAP